MTAVNSIAHGRETAREEDLGYGGEKKRRQRKDGRGGMHGIGNIVPFLRIIAAFLMNFNSGIVMVLLLGGALTAAERFMQGGENMPCSARFCGQRRR